MFRRRLAPSLVAITLLAFLSGASATALADSRDDRGRCDGPPPKGFQKYESKKDYSKKYDAKARDRYGYRYPSHHWSRDHRDRGYYYRPPAHRAPPPWAYYKPPYKPNRPQSGSYRLGHGVTIVLDDDWRR